MAQNHEIDIDGIILRPNENGEYMPSAAADSAEYETVTPQAATVTRYEPISATRTFSLEDQPVKPAALVNPSVMSDESKAPEAPVESNQLAPAEKQGRLSKSGIRRLGAVVLYTSLFSTVSITGYNMGHAENIEDAFDVIPAISQTWHEGASVINFWGGKL